MASWLVGRVLSLENRETVTAIQWWALAQDSLGRSEQWKLHALLQLCNISLETMQRFISLSHSPNFWSSKFQFPMVLLAFFSAVFWLHTVCSLSPLYFLSILLHKDIDIWYSNQMQKYWWVALWEDRTMQIKKKYSCKIDQAIFKFISLISRSYFDNSDLLESSIYLIIYLNFTSWWNF